MTTRREPAPVSPIPQHGDTGEGTAPPPSVSMRWGYVLAIALPLIVLNTGWIAHSEMKTSVTELTISTLFIGVTFLLFLITLFNLLVRRWFAPLALNQPELMLLYSVLSISSVVAGVGHFGFLTPYLTYPFQNPNAVSFLNLLPWYIGPRDPEILNGFYRGNATFFVPTIMAAWAGPLFAACAFFLLLLWTSFCLAAIVRRRWADEERLNFPVLALPLEMTREGAPIYRERLLWAGFAIPFVLHSLNSLNSMYPALPSFPINSVKNLVSVAALQSPWNGMNTLYYALHPAGVGFGYLINTDVSFSLWFFYLLKKAMNVWGVTMGWREPFQGDAAPQFPFTGFQGCGAWLTLGVITLWTGRRYYADYFRRAWNGDPLGVDRTEPLSARMATGGFVAGFLILCVFVWSSGGSLWLPPVFLGIYALITLSLARIRAETGVVCTELAFINPQTLLPSLLGTSAFSPLDKIHLGTLSCFNLDYRANGTPHALEGMVGINRARGASRPFVSVLLIAAIVAMLSALVWDLQLYYVNGAATGNVNTWRINTKSREPWEMVERLLKDPKPPDPHAVLGIGAGCLITCLLIALRGQFVSFPLHPAAYVLNVSFANDFFWCDMFVAWALKSLLLRYGGMRLYRLALPFFLGLILGDFVTGATWSLIGTGLGVSLFRTFAT